MKSSRLFSHRFHHAMLGVALTISAANAQAVAGRVVGDSSHQPLPRVRVILLDSAAAEPVDSAQTDSVGVFFVQAPRPGTYILAFERPNAAPSFSRSWRLSRDDDHQGLFALPEDSVFHALRVSDVDQRAIPLRANKAPQYPDNLRRAEVQGNVLLHVIVDPAGRVVPSNITILEATAPEFEASVRSAATAFRFEAARKFGRQVYQVFCMPVTFRLQPGNDREARHLDSLATQWGKDGVCPSNEMRLNSRRDR